MNHFLLRKCQLAIDRGKNISFKTTKESGSTTIVRKVMASDEKSSLDEK